MEFDLQGIVRPNILRLKPYSSARCEFGGDADVFLDANENALASPAGPGYNRYPDPLQRELKARVSELNRVPAENIFVGNGSDEGIDLLFRIFCEPGRDACIICPPTYGMYRVSADTNDVAIRKVLLTEDFQLDVPGIIASSDEHTKLIFICSPNNPTGNLMRREDVIRIAQNFGGLVVVDEAYIHFSDEESFVHELENVPNIVVLQTFSKAWAMAGVRVGLAFANPEIIDLMNRIKPPYNVSGIAQRAVLEALTDPKALKSWVADTLRERDRLISAFEKFDIVRKIYPTDANFVLVKTVDPNAIYKHLINEAIVVRNRTSVELCDGCLRITIGTSAENSRLLDALNKFQIAKPKAGN